MVDGVEVVKKTGRLTWLFWHTVRAVSWVALGFFICAIGMGAKPFGVDVLSW